LQSSGSERAGLAASLGRDHDTTGRSSPSSRAKAPDQPPGLLGYEGQPGNQGGHNNNNNNNNGTPNGLKGYEGQPGNQGGH
jgi:hypothetical protein